MRDEQSNQRGIMQVFRDVALKGAEVITGRPVYVRCRSCGEWKERGCKSECRLHPPVPEGVDPIYIHFAASPEPTLPEPPKVERLGRSSEQRQVSNRFKDPTKTDPVRQQPEEDDPTDEWAGVRNTGGYKRKEAPASDWGMSSEELAKAQDRADGYDVDPVEPDVPRYGV